MIFNEAQAEAIVALFPEIVSATNRHITYINRKGNRTKSSHAQFIQTLDRGELLKIPGVPDIFSTGVKVFNSALSNLVTNYVLNELGDMEEDVSSTSTKNIKTILAGLTPCVNITDPEEMILVDSEYRRSCYSAELLRTALQMPDDVIYSRAYYAKFDYNPRRPERIFQERIGHEIVESLNTYTPPKWMEHEIEDPQIPDLIEKFMVHLVPDETERAYVYDWLHKSLTDRAYVYLLLNGAKKTGKNTFKYIFKALHGYPNSVDGKKSTLTTQFNSQLADCRALILDEIKFSEEEENVMKEIQNDNVAIERKGVDATRGSKIHCSILLLNNDAKDNYIAVDSRRFSPINITNTPLLSSMTEDEISEMVGKIREDSDTYDIEFVANFGHWLLQYGRDERWKKEEEYIGPKFHELVQTSLSEWRRFTLKFIDEMKRSESDHRYKLSEIEEKFYKKLGSKSAKKYPDYGRVINFLTHYRDINGKHVADFERVEGEYDFFIYPKEKLIRANSEDNLSYFKAAEETVEEVQEEEEDYSYGDL